MVPRVALWQKMYEIEVTNFQSFPGTAVISILGSLQALAVAAPSPLWPPRWWGPNSHYSLLIQQKTLF